MQNRFSLYELRTTNVASASVFYSKLLGADLPNANLPIVPLPARAAERGAPAHWLGHIGVGDVDAVVARVLGDGGQALGPVQRAAGGVERAAVRDPFGAVLGLSRQNVGEPVLAAGVGTACPSVAWHLLHAVDPARAFAWYASLFGWVGLEEPELEAEPGRQRSFAYDETQRAVGGVTNAARLAHVHPQWMFCFQVADLEGGLSRVREQGGKALEPVSLASGARVAACDDAEGAAFALYQAVSNRA